VARQRSKIERRRTGTGGMILRSSASLTVTVLRRFEGGGVSGEWDALGGAQGGGVTQFHLKPEERNGSTRKKEAGKENVCTGKEPV